MILSEKSGLHPFIYNTQKPVIEPVDCLNHPVGQFTTHLLVVGSANKPEGQESAHVLVC